MNRIARPRASRADAGFTLVELMVVVAIAAVLVSAAVVMVRPERYARSSWGVGEQIVAELENMRLRAVATRKWQRLSISSNQVVHQEAATEGMVKPVDPDDWNDLKTLSLPSGIFIHSVDDETHLEAGGELPAAGTGLGDALPIDFAPDGAGMAATLFVGDDAGDRRTRVTTFQATGAAYLYAGW